MNLDFSDLMASCISTIIWPLYIKFIRMSLFPWLSLFLTLMILIFELGYRCLLSTSLYKAMISFYFDEHLHLIKSPILKVIS